MFAGHLAIALRRQRRYPGQALAAIGCLGVGLTVCLLIGLFLRYELGYDTWQPDAERVYRVNWINVGTGARFATFFNPVSPLLADGLAEVEDYSRLFPTDVLLEADGVRHFPRLSLVDPQHFAFFRYETLAGTTTAIGDLSGAVITQAAAQQFFGDVDAVGRRFTVNETLSFRVGAVVANNPGNTHLTDNVFINIDNVTTLFDSPGFWDNPGSDVMYHYVRLAPGAEPARVADAAVNYLRGQLPLPAEFTRAVDIALQPLGDIHFTTDLQNEMAIRDSMTGLAKPHRQRSDLALFAGLSPALALRGRVSGRLSGTGLRAGLVTLQFAISIGLVIASGVVNRQLDYAMEKSLGFDPDDVVIVGLGLPAARQAYDTLRTELLGQAVIESVSAGSVLPTQSLSDGAVFNRVVDGSLASLATRRISISDGYFDALDMEFAPGPPRPPARFMRCVRSEGDVARGGYHSY